MQKNLHISKGIVALIVAFIMAVAGSLFAVMSTYSLDGGAHTADDVAVSTTAVDTSGTQAEYRTCTEADSTTHVHVNDWKTLLGYIDADKGSSTTYCFGKAGSTIPTSVSNTKFDFELKDVGNNQIIDGCGRTFTVTRSHASGAAANTYVGLMFEQLRANATVKNMNITFNNSVYYSADRSGDNHLGILAGYSLGTIENVHLQMHNSKIGAKITSAGAKGSVGGLVGNVSGGGMYNVSADIWNDNSSTYDCTMTTFCDGTSGTFGKWSDAFVGGIAGRVEGAARICGATIDITGTKTKFVPDGYTDDGGACTAGGVAGYVAANNVHGVYIKNIKSSYFITNNTGKWGAVSGQCYGAKIDTSIIVDDEIKTDINGFARLNNVIDSTEELSCVNYLPAGYSLSFAKNGDNADIVISKNDGNKDKIWWSVSNDVDNTDGQKTYTFYNDAKTTDTSIRLGADKLKGTASTTLEKKSLVILDGVVVNSYEVSGDRGTITYDGNPHTLTVTYKDSTGKTYGSPVTKTVTNASARQELSIHPAGADDANRALYNYTVGANPTIQIVPKPITVSVNSTNIPLFGGFVTATASTGVANDTLQLKLVETGTQYDSGTVISDFTEAREYTVTAVITTGMQSNYAITDAKFTVEPSHINLIGGGFTAVDGLTINGQDGTVTKKTIKFDVDSISANSRIVNVMCGDTELVTTNIKHSSYTVALDRDDETITTEFANDVYTVGDKKYEYGEKATVTIPADMNTVKLNGTVVAYGNAGSTYTFTVRGDSAITFENTTISNFTVNFKNVAGNIIFSETVAAGTIEEYLADKNNAAFYASKGGYELYRTFSSWRAVAVDKGSYDAIPQFQVDDGETTVQKLTLTFESTTTETYTVDYNSVVTLDSPSGQDVYWTVNDKAVYYGSSYTFAVLDNYKVGMLDSSPVNGVVGVVMTHEVVEYKDDDIFMTGIVGEDIVKEGYKLVLTVKNDSIGSDEYVPAVVLTLNKTNQFINGVDLDVLNGSKTGAFTATLYGVKTVDSVETQVVLGTYKFILQ